MKKKKIIVLGGGGHAKVVIGTLLKMPRYEVVGFLDDDEKKTNILGIPRIGSLFPVHEERVTKVVALGLGHVGNCSLRKKVAQTYEKRGYVFETIIAPSCIISKTVQIGKGVFISDGTVIQPDVIIGDYSIINTRSSLDHDCLIGENVHIAPGVTLSGMVNVGDNTLVGTGSSVIQEISVVKNCIIGAGAVVIRDCKKSGTYVGVPAKLKKQKNIRKAL